MHDGAPPHYARTARNRLDNNLEERIHTVLNNVPQEFLKNSTNNVQVRLQKCIDNHGGYVEF
jgi:hypothetical protein